MSGKSGLEACIAAVRHQIRQIRAQRRPRPAQLQVKIDQLLWRCCRQLPLDSFQHVYDDVADPLSDLHSQIRMQAMAKHGHALDVSMQPINPQSILQLLKWSSRQQDLSLFYQIWDQNASEVVQWNDEVLWRLASHLSGRAECRRDVLADIVSVLASREQGQRVAQFLYDCILRYSTNAGFEAGADLCRQVHTNIGSSHNLAVELGVLLIEDERSSHNSNFLHECICLCKPALTGDVPDYRQRLVKLMNARRIQDNVLAAIRHEDCLNHLKIDSKQKIS